MKNQKILNNSWTIIVVLIIIAAIGGYGYYTYYFKGLDINSLKKSEVSVNPPSINETGTGEEVVEEKAVETQKSEAEQVVMKITTDKSEYKLNELVNVNISLALADKKTPGVDVLAKYDPKSLELQKVSGGVLQTNGVVSDPKQVLKTSQSSFEIFPYLKADILDGSIFFSALDKPKEYVAGNANIASLVFKVIKTGNAKISLSFDKNKSLDTEVFYMGNAILDKVVNADIVIE